jgi:hypothetical protein
VNASFQHIKDWSKRNPHASGLLGGLGFVLGIVAAIFALAGLMITLRDTVGGGNRAKSRAVCDEAVETLLTSKDLVEVTRAGILVNQIECNIRSRLP